MSVTGQLLRGTIQPAKRINIETEKQPLERVADACA
jgi:hypothetical protein